MQINFIIVNFIFNLNLHSSFKKRLKLLNKYFIKFSFQKTKLKLINIKIL